MPDGSAKKSTTEGESSSADDSSLRWTTASSGVLDAAKWLTTAIAGVATVVLGAGPLLNPKTDVSAWGAGRWAVALLLAAVAATCVAAIVAHLLALLVPVEITLDTLPPKLRTRIESNELSEYLPGEAADLRQFKNQLITFSKATVNLKTLAARETDNNRKADLLARSAVMEGNRDKYLAKRKEIYALARYEIERERLTSGTKLYQLGAALVVAVICLTAFTFVTSTGGDADDDAQESDVPAGGQLLRTNAIAEVWKTLRLSRCAVGASVPVIVLSETDEAYRIQTLGAPDGCDRYVFSVPRDGVNLLKVEPVEATITTTGE
jgi:hypothetical protein